MDVLLKFSTVKVCSLEYDKVEGSMLGPKKFGSSLFGETQAKYNTGDNCLS